MKATTKTITLFATTLILFSTISLATAQNQTRSYQLLDHPDGNITYELNVIIPENLNHQLLKLRNPLRITAHSG